jgi:hypothetical protein
MKLNKKAVIITSVVLGAAIGATVYFVIKNNTPVKLTDEQVKYTLVSYVLIDKNLADTAQNRALYNAKTIDELKAILAQ